MELKRQLKIETNIALRHMTTLERLIDECLCFSKYSELEKNLWKSIESKDLKKIRKYRYDIEQIIDDIEMD